MAGLGLLLSSLASPAVSALERSVDTQLVHPVLSPEGGITVDSPRGSEPWRLLSGLALQYEDAPLEVYANAQPMGDAVQWRGTAHLLAAMPVTDSTTLYLRGSAIAQQAGDLTELSPRRSFALGDLALGCKSALLRRERLALGPRLDLWLPVGSDDSWVAEQGLRLAPALLFSLDGERVGLLAQVGVYARRSTDSQADFLAGSELNTGLTAKLRLVSDVAALAELSSRHGFANFMQAGAENPVEVKGGLRLKLGEAGQLDLALGTALNHGYGASRLRGLLAFVKLPGRRPQREEEPVVAPSVPMTIEASVETAAAPPQEVLVPLQLAARVEHGRIVMDSPVFFASGSAELQPGALAALRGVAVVLNEYPQIEHLVVEGHACEGGSAAEAYGLSLARARVVFEALVSAGVRPERLSYRGMGLSQPLAAGQPGALGRRVELDITAVRALQDGPPAENVQPLILPWSGERRAAPVMGDKLLSADAHPLLLKEFESTRKEEPVPYRDLFREALDEDAATPAQETSEPDAQPAGEEAP